MASNSVAAANGASERRLGLDGKLYTYAEFVAYYEAMWRNAPSATSGASTCSATEQTTRAPAGTCPAPAQHAASHLSQVQAGVSLESAPALVTADEKQDELGRRLARCRRALPDFAHLSWDDEQTVHALLCGIVDSPQDVDKQRLFALRDSFVLVLGLHLQHYHVSDKQEIRDAMYHRIVSYLGEDDERVDALQSQLLNSWYQVYTRPFSTAGDPANTVPGINL